MRTTRRALLLSFSAASTSFAQLKVDLDPKTVEEFKHYSHQVESELTKRWTGERSFLSIQDEPEELRKVLAGDLIVRPAIKENPVPVYKGLIHDWVGTVFVSDTSMNALLEILQNFDRHSQYYPNIIKSKLIKRVGDEIEGFWRLERKDPLFPQVLDVTQLAHYHRWSSDKWSCRAFTERISEVEDAGTPDEKSLPPNRGHGFLWSFDAFWSLQRWKDGVLAECRTISLSRDVPRAFTWAVKPFIQALPRDTLAGTLRDTRKAATGTRSTG
jgi:hypothetical protein